MKIMIVDDNPKMRDLIQSMLGEIAHERCEAKDGLEAVLKYSDELPDVVLMDIRMPVMSGIDATKRILQENPSAKVVIVTEFDTPLYRDAAKKAGAKEYVLKENLHELNGKLISVMSVN